MNVPPGAAGPYGSALPAGSRPVYLEEFSDGSGFVFNAANPSGIRYLAKHALAVYRNLLGPEGQPPIVDAYNGPLYAEFIRKGIAKPRYAAQQPARRKSARPPHFAVWFHIVNACNLGCSYCYIPDLQRRVDGASALETAMSPETIHRATSSLFEFCKERGYQSLQIKFAGGEPALCLNQIRMACEAATRCAEQSGIAVKFAMLSNGVLVDEELCALLKQYGMSISISVDGDMEAHDAVRFTILNSESSGGCKSHTRAGTWNTIAANILRLTANGITPYLMCTVTERNYNRLAGLFDFSLGNRIGVRLSMVRDHLSHLKPGLLNRILDELRALYDGFGESMPIDLPIQRYAAFGDWNPAVKKEAICSACRTYAAIDHRGKVASCQMGLSRARESILTDSFSSVFSRLQNAEENLYLITPGAKTGSCSRCYWRFACAGGCPEHTRAVTGSPNAPSPWCDLYQSLLPDYLRAIARQMKRRAEAAEAGDYAGSHACCQG